MSEEEFSKEELSSLIVLGSEWGGSRLSDAQKCKKYYFWRHELPTESGRGIEPQQGRLVASRGTILHGALRYYYKHLAMKEQVMAREELELKTIHVGASLVELLVSDPVAVKPLQDEVISALDQYFEKYRSDDLVPIDSEIPFEMKVGPYVHTGFIDLLALWRDCLYVVDHKSTGMNLNIKFKQLTFNLSLRGYAKAMRELYGKEVNVMVNGIQFKNNKAMEVVCDRELYHYTQEELDEFEPTVCSIRQEVKNCQDSNYWPKNENECYVFGECEYFRLCKFHGNKDMINAFYKTRKEVKPK